MTYYDPNEFQAREFVSGLRRLAYFLERNRALPSPLNVDMIVFPRGETDEARCAEVTRIGAALRSEVHHDHHGSGHCRTSKSFGGVSYTAVAISTRARARHDALMSYDGSIHPTDADAW
ncbi:hypothetical protein GT755_35770 [Herbidospora sp. NEAU-GS84]|uniref:Uncharacterized protein n=1 Tax=Herbidospora solisilvae TaxID=2696284 RepID=A0A7C9NSZ7_9ACTN|nr:hypothetical protein [Herbidospora solisilvae]NAS27016.1 hypothetical protein [Herbidospora solisilvae]